MNNDKECDLEGKREPKMIKSQSQKNILWTLSRTDHCLGLNFPSYIILKTTLMLEFGSGWNGPLDKELKEGKN